MISLLNKKQKLNQVYLVWKFYIMTQGHMAALGVWATKNLTPPPHPTPTPPPPPSPQKRNFPKYRHMTPISNGNAKLYKHCVKKCPNTELFLGRIFLS